MQTQSPNKREVVFAFRALTVRVDISTFYFHVYHGEAEIDPQRTFTTKDEAIYWIIQNVERTKGFADFHPRIDQAVKESARNKGVITKTATLPDEFLERVTQWKVEIERFDSSPDETMILEVYLKKGSRFKTEGHALEFAKEAHPGFKRYSVSALTVHARTKPILVQEFQDINNPAK